MMGYITIYTISIHALREEGDVKTWNVRDQTDTFLSTPSARRATRTPLQHFRPYLFLSTPSARRATK